MGIVVEVAGDERAVAVREHVFHRAVAGSFHDRVDLVDRGVARGDEREIDEGHVDGGHANGETVKLAVQFRQHEADRSGRPGLGRNHVVRGSTGATQVLVEDIGQHLIVGVAVNGVHQTVHDAHFLVQHFCHWCQAVGGAARVADDRVARLEHVVIYAINYCGINILFARCRDDDLLRATGQVSACARFAGEQAGAFEHHLDTAFTPRNFRRITNGEHLDVIAFDDQMITLNSHCLAEFAVRGVKARQVRVGLAVTEIVDRFDLDIGAARLV